jgi:hypothetical protein
MSTWPVERHLEPKQWVSLQHSCYVGSGIRMRSL